MNSRHTLPLLALSLVASLAACGRDPLTLLPAPVAVGYDNEDVLDVAPFDLDHDGDTDLVVALPSGLRYLSREGTAWHDATPGTALEKAGPVRAMRPDGEDLLIQRPDGVLARLEYGGIGAWHEGGAAPTGLPDPPRVVDADLDRNGRIDHAELNARTVRVSLRGVDDALHEASRTVGTDALSLRGEGHALYAADLDGDGDTDLLAVGGRIMAYVNNGGPAPGG